MRDGVRETCLYTVYAIFVNKKLIHIFNGQGARRTARAPPVARAPYGFLASRLGAQPGRRTARGAPTRCSPPPTPQAAHALESQSTVLSLACGLGLGDTRGTRARATQSTTK